ncbi:AraC family transcriptional regulator [Microcoleus sp. herbarium19]|uniref:AraC family transcriptional regulator n=1 Tax=unclassified Microcoleus TaxID=2642155 RepID=UPI002FD099B8
MTFTLTRSDWNELWDSTNRSPNPQTAIDSFETVCQMPSCLGSGYSRDLQLASGIWLNLSDCTCQQDWTLKVPDHDHLIQIYVVLSGTIDTEGVHPTLGKNRAYFSGSGISPSYGQQHYSGQRLMTVNVELEPALLEPLFGEDEPSRENLRSLLCKEQDWKASFYPTVTVAMRSLAQQIWNAPYHGVAKQMYLQGKVWELLAMQIDLVMADRIAPVTAPKLRPDTIARLHHAKEILTNQLEYPPLLSELAQLVGVSERTLQRGFQTLFKTTVLGYVTEQRLVRAECLLRSGDRTVAEVANLVGYGHFGHFAAAFRRQFGIAPSQCVAGEKLASKHF